MSKLNGRVTAVLTAYLVSLRQLGNGKTIGRVDFAKNMLPHVVKNGQLKTIDGKKLYDWEGEDCEVIPAKLFEQKVATDAWLNNIVTAVNVNLLGSASEQAKAEAEDVDEVEAEALAENDVNDDVVAPDDEAVDTSALDKAIKKGKAKKATKLLEEIADELTKAERKSYKNAIKEL